MPTQPPLLIRKLTQQYPQFRFSPSDAFYWSPNTRTVHYATPLQNREGELLHELSHALLGHSSFIKDIELLRIEREAWMHAISLSATYGVVIKEEEVEEALDTYRDWLHARSTCPDCQTNGLQTKTDTYKCFACGCQWRANDARKCALRRFRL